MLSPGKKVQLKKETNQSSYRGRKTKRKGTYSKDQTPLRPNEANAGKTGCATQMKDCYIRTRIEDSKDIRKRLIPGK